MCINGFKNHTYKNLICIRCGFNVWDRYRNDSKKRCIKQKQEGLFFKEWNPVISSLSDSEKNFLVNFVGKKLRIVNGLAPASEDISLQEVNDLKTLCAFLKK